MLINGPFLSLLPFLACCGQLSWAIQAWALSWFSVLTLSAWERQTCMSHPYIWLGNRLGDYFSKLPLFALLLQAYLNTWIPIQIFKIGGRLEVCLNFTSKSCSFTPLFARALQKEVQVFTRWFINNWFASYLVNILSISIALVKTAKGRLVSSTPVSPTSMKHCFPSPTREPHWWSFLIYTNSHWFPFSVFFIIYSP